MPEARYYTPESRERANANLVYRNQDKYPLEVRQEWGRKGGMAQKKNLMLRDCLLKIMALPCDDDEVAAELADMGVPNSFEFATMLAAVRRAMKGDAEALRFIRDTRGEKPMDAVTLGIMNTPVKALDMSQLTDTQLMALADREDQLALEEADDPELTVPLLPEPEREGETLDSE